MLKSRPAKVHLYDRRGSDQLPSLRQTVGRLYQERLIILVDDLPDSIYADFCTLYRESAQLHDISLDAPLSKAVEEGLFSLDKSNRECGSTSVLDFNYVVFPAVELGG